MGTPSRRTLAPASLLFFFVCLSAPAAAEEPLRRLVYRRGPGTDHCPDEAYLRAAIRAQLGFEPFHPDAPEKLVVTLSLNKKEERIDFTLEPYSADGTPGVLLRGWGPVKPCDRTLLNGALWVADLYNPLPGPLPLPAPKLSPPTSASAPVPSLHSRPHAMRAVTASPHAMHTASVPSNGPRQTAVRPAKSPRPEEDEARWLALCIDVGGSSSVALSFPVSLVVGLAVRERRWSVGVAGRFDFAGTTPEGTARGHATHMGAAIMGCGMTNELWGRLSLHACAQAQPMFLTLLYDREGASNMSAPYPSMDGLGSQLIAEMRIKDPLRVHLALEALLLFRKEQLFLSARTHAPQAVSFSGALRVGVVGLFDL